MPWIILICFTGILFLFTWLILVLSGGSFLTLIGVTVALVVLVWAWLAWDRLSAIRGFRSAYPGKDLLIVLTDSPHWQTHIETHWLSRWGDRAVVFNRSRPWTKDQPEARLWNALKGVREHTPVAIVIKSARNPLVIRFFKAFRDLKHGNDAALLEKERELSSALAIASISAGSSLN